MQTREGLLASFEVFEMSEKAGGTDILMDDRDLKKQERSNALLT